MEDFDLVIRVGADIDFSGIETLKQNINQVNQAVTKFTSSLDKHSEFSQPYIAQCRALQASIVNVQTSADSLTDSLDKGQLTQDSANQAVTELMNQYRHVMTMNSLIGDTGDYSLKMAHSMFEGLPKATQAELNKMRPQIASIIRTGLSNINGSSIFNTKDVGGVGGGGIIGAVMRSKQVKQMLSNSTSVKEADLQAYLKSNIALMMPLAQSTEYGKTRYGTRYNSWKLDSNRAQSASELLPARFVDALSGSGFKKQNYSANDAAGRQTLNQQASQQLQDLLRQNGIATAAALSSGLLSYGKNGSARIKNNITRNDLEAYQAAISDQINMRVAGFGDKKLSNILDPSNARTLANRLQSGNTGAAVAAAYVASQIADTSSYWTDNDRIRRASYSPIKVAQAPRERYGVRNYQMNPDGTLTQTQYTPMEQSLATDMAGLKGHDYQNTDKFIRINVGRMSEDELAQDSVKNVIKQMYALDKNGEHQGIIQNGIRYLPIAEHGNGMDTTIILGRQDMMHEVNQKHNRDMQRITGDKNWKGDFWSGDVGNVDVNDKMFGRFRDAKYKLFTPSTALQSDLSDLKVVVVNDKDHLDGTGWISSKYAQDDMQIRAGGMFKGTLTRFTGDNFGDHLTNMGVQAVNGRHYMKGINGDVDVTDADIVIDATTFKNMFGVLPENATNEQINQIATARFKMQDALRSVRNFSDDSFAAKSLGNQASLFMMPTEATAQKIREDQTRYIKTLMQQLDDPEQAKRIVFPDKNADRVSQRVWDEENYPGYINSDEARRRIDLYKQARMIEATTGQLFSTPTEDGLSHNITQSRLLLDPLIANAVQTGVVSDETVNMVKASLTKRLGENWVKDNPWIFDEKAARPDFNKNAQTITDQFIRDALILKSNKDRNTGVVVDFNTGATIDDIKKGILETDVGIIRSPTGLGNMVFGKNRAGILRPFFEDNGMDLHKMQINPSIMKALSGADMDGDQVKVLRGIYAQAVSQTLNKIYETNPNAMKQIKGMEEQYNKKYGNSDDPEAYYDYIVRSQKAARLMGFYSRGGESVMQYALNGNLINTAMQATHGYDLASTLAKKPVELMTDKQIEIINTLKNGRQFNALGSKQSGIFDVRQVQYQKEDGTIGKRFENGDGQVIDDKDVYVYKPGGSAAPVFMNKRVANDIGFDKMNMPSVHNFAAMNAMTMSRGIYEAGNTDLSRANALTAMLTDTQNGIGFDDMLNAGNFKNGKAAITAYRGLLSMFAGGTKHALTDNDISMLRAYSQAAMTEFEDYADKHADTIGTDVQLPGQSGKFVSRKQFLSSARRASGLDRIDTVLNHIGITKDNLIADYGEEEGNRIYGVLHGDDVDAPWFSGPDWSPVATNVKNTSHQTQQPSRNLRHGTYKSKAGRSLIPTQQIQVPNQVDSYFVNDEYAGRINSAHEGYNGPKKHRQFADDATLDYQEANWKHGNVRYEYNGYHTETINTEFVNNKYKGRKFKLQRAAENVNQVAETAAENVSEQLLSLVTGMQSAQPADMRKLVESNIVAQQLSDFSNGMKSYAGKMRGYQIQDNAIDRTQSAQFFESMNGKLRKDAYDLERFRSMAQDPSSGITEPILKELERQYKDEEQQAYVGSRAFANLHTEDILSRTKSLLNPKSDRLVSQLSTLAQFKKQADEINSLERQFNDSFGKRQTGNLDQLKLDEETRQTIADAKNQVSADSMKWLQQQQLQNGTFFSNESAKLYKQLYGANAPISQQAQSMAAQMQMNIGNMLPKLDEYKQNGLLSEQDYNLRKKQFEKYLDYANSDDYKKYLTDMGFMQQDRSVNQLVSSERRLGRQAGSMYGNTMLQRMMNMKQNEYYQRQDLAYSLDAQKRNLQGQLDQMTANGDTKSADYAKTAAELDKVTAAADRNKASMAALTGPLSAANAAFATFGITLNRIGTQFARQMFQKMWKEAKQFVQEFDKSMTQIQMITLKSDEEMAGVRSNTINKAINLKTSVSNVASTEAALYRQGLSESEVSARTDQIIKFAAVTGVKVEDAMKGATVAMQSGLVSTIQEATDGMVVLGDAAATTAAEISKGMQKSAAGAKVAGVSYNELLSLITIGTSKTQLGGNQVGTALKTLFARMGKVTDKGYYSDINGESLTLNDAEKALNIMGVSLRDENGGFRSRYDVLYDVATKWQGSSDMQKSVVTNALAGTRATNIFQTLMEGMSEDGGEELRKFMETLQGSNGITDKKYDIYAESLAASLDTLKSSFDGFVASIAKSDAFTGIIDGLSEFLQLMTAVTNGSGGFIVAMSALAGVLAGVGTTILTGLVPGLRLFAPLLGLAAGVGTFAVIGRSESLKTQSGIDYQYEQSRKTSANENQYDTSSVQNAINAMNRTITSFEEGSATSAQLATSFANLQSSCSSIGISLENTTGDLDGYRAAVNQAAAAMSELTAASLKQKAHVEAEEKSKTVNAETAEAIDGLTFVDKGLGESLTYHTQQQKGLSGSTDLSDNSEAESIPVSENSLLHFNQNATGSSRDIAASIGDSINSSSTVQQIKQAFSNNGIALQTSQGSQIEDKAAYAYSTNGLKLVVPSQQLVDLSDASDEAIRAAYLSSGIMSDSKAVDRSQLWKEIVDYNKQDGFINPATKWLNVSYRDGFDGDFVDAFNDDKVDLYYPDGEQLPFEESYDTYLKYQKYAFMNAYQHLLDKYQLSDNGAVPSAESASDQFAHLGEWAEPSMEDVGEWENWVEHALNGEYGLKFFHRGSSAKTTDQMRKELQESGVTQVLDTYERNLFGDEATAEADRVTGANGNPETFSNNIRKLTDLGYGVHYDDGNPYLTAVQNGEVTTRSISALTGMSRMLFPTETQYFSGKDVDANNSLIHFYENKFKDPEYVKNTANPAKGLSGFVDYDDFIAQMTAYTNNPELLPSGDVEWMFENALRGTVKDENGNWVTPKKPTPTDEQKKQMAKNALMGYEALKSLKTQAGATGQMLADSVIQNMPDTYFDKDGYIDTDSLYKYEILPLLDSYYEGNENPINDKVRVALPWDKMPYHITQTGQDNQVINTGFMSLDEALAHANKYNISRMNIMTKDGNAAYPAIQSMIDASSLKDRTENNSHISEFARLNELIKGKTFNDAAFGDKGFFDYINNNESLYSDMQKAMTDSSVLFALNNFRVKNDGSSWNYLQDVLANKATGQELSSDTFKTISSMIGFDFSSVDSMKESMAAINSLTDEGERSIAFSGLEAMKELIPEFGQALADLAKDATTATGAVDNFQNALGTKAIKEANKYKQNVIEITNAYQGIKKGGLAATTVIDNVTSQARKLSDKSYALKSFASGNRDDDVLTEMSQISGFGKDKLKGATDEWAKSLVDSLQKSLDNEETALLDVINEGVLAPFNETFMDDGNWSKYLSDIDIGTIDVSGSVDASALIAAIGDANLAAYAEAMKLAELQLQVVKAGNGYKIVATKGSGYGGGFSGGGGKGGGGGKKQSDADKLLKQLKHDQEMQDHILKMVQYEQTKYQNAGQLGNYGKMLEAEIKLEREYLPLLESHIQKLRAQMNATERGTDDWFDLRDALLDAEEKMAELNNTIDENIKKLKENQQAILKLKSDLQETVLEEIQNRIQKDRDMLDGRVQMEETILNAIKNRYTSEWELLQKDIQKKKDALQEELALIDERLQKRKKAEDSAKKYEQLTEYKNQLASIEMDPTRTKDALKLRKQIAELESDIGWDISDSQANAEKNQIEDQIKAYEEYESEYQEYLDKFLEDANNFSAEVNEVLGMSHDDMIDWLKRNDQDYIHSLEDAQQQLLENWEDTFKKMMGIVDTYWDQINEIIKGKESFLDYMKRSDTYKNASDEQKAQMEYEWQKMWDNWAAAQDTSAVFDHSDAGITNVTYVGEGKGSGSGDNGGTYRTPQTYGFTFNGKKYGGYSSEADAQAAIDRIYKTTEKKELDKLKGSSNPAQYQSVTQGLAQEKYKAKKSIAPSTKKYATGGLVDYTGPAWVDGTKTKPEAFLSAEDTALMRSMLDAAKFITLPSFTSIIPESAYTNNSVSSSVGDVYVKIEAAKFDSDADYELIAQRVGDVISKELSKQGMSTAAYTF